MPSANAMEGHIRSSLGHSAAAQKSALRLVLGDQLTSTLEIFTDCDKERDIVLLAEVAAETGYVRHHKKKIAFLFSAMRHFAKALIADGFRVQYTTLDHPDNAGSLGAEAARVARKFGLSRVVVTFPGEYRLYKEMQSWQDQFSIAVEILHDTRFLCSPREFRDWAKGRNSLRMEFFYREMRKKYRILLESDGKPVGGKWNYDAANRKPPKSGLEIPAPTTTPEDTITQDVKALVAETFSDHFGDIEPFYFAVTRDQALKVLAEFIDQRLPSFGDYQDAMLEGEPWMYHSHLSFYLNCGLLLPLECAQAAEDAYAAGHAPLNAVEGFIRQIIGWREYVRGIYWLHMPDYKTRNFFAATRPLPEFYWTAQTEMNCLKQCIGETKAHAYAHHIQRLMILGNFALLTGIHPDEVNEWYLIVYADAYEWVELPNVTGMVLFADGGYLASKPYAAGGSYINKMSNYCKGCTYKVSKKTGEGACPFNYLYWDFLIRHRDKLASNHRLGMIYKSYDRMTEDKKTAIAADAEVFLENLR